MVTPRRVIVTRNTKKAGSWPLKFHRSERLHVVAIAAGMRHTSCISEDGSVFYWASGDPNLQCRQVTYVNALPRTCSVKFQLKFLN